MLKFVGVVPHSPLLIPQQSTKFPLPKAVHNGFIKLGDKFKENSIEHVVVLGSHPKFERSPFSVYIADSYSITFSEFGDLITKVGVNTWWSGYDKLSGLMGASLLEPISSSEIDYAHGIPLYYINQQFDEGKQLSFLCINISGEVDDDQTSQFIEQLKVFFQSTSEPVALLCSGDLFLTKELALAVDVNQANKTISESIKASFTMPNNLPEFSDQVSIPCLSGTMKIGKAIVSSARYNYEQFCFEQTQKTSFLISGITIY